MLFRSTGELPVAGWNLLSKNNALREFILTAEITTQQPDNNDNLTTMTTLKKTTMKKIYYLLLVSLFSINLATAQEKEVNIDTEVGTLPGRVGVSPTGAATYTIPIDLPEGRAGMTPQLAFVYNSHVEGNIMGKGWGVVGFSSISRTNPTLYYNDEIDNVDFEDDQFILDGQRLIYVRDTEDGIEYRTEVDNGQKLIYYINEEKPFFKVYLKNGIVKEYGTYGSRQYYGTDDSNPLAWHLKRVVDIMGNKIEYMYDRNISIGELHPIMIEYTNFEDKNRNEKYSITFNYDGAVLNDNQHLISYLEKKNYNGTYDKYINQNTNLLYSISITHNDHLLKKYELSYFTEMSSTKDVFLKDILLGNDVKKFNPTIFDWNFYNPNYESASFWVNDHTNMLHLINKVNMSRIDIDGDGVDEVAVYKVLADEINYLTSDVYIYSGSSPLHIIHLDLQDPDAANVSLSSADFDNDGNEELIVNIHESTLQVYSFVTGSKSELVFEYEYLGNNYIPFTGDLTGDGITDCFLVNDNDKKVKLLTGTGNNSYLSEGEENDFPSNVDKIKALSDFTGDMRTDVVGDFGDRFQTYSYTEINGFSLQTGSCLMCQTSVGKYYFQDFNGDGKTDICQLNISSKAGFTKNTYFSFGSGFVEDAEEESLPTFLDPNSGYPIAIDLNNDGRSDFIYIGLGDIGYRTQAYYTMKKGVNQSDSEMQEIEISPYIEGIAALTFADLTGSGIMDYAVEFWRKEEIIQNDIKDYKTEVNIIFYLYNFKDNQCGENHLIGIQNGFGVVSKINYQMYGSSYSNSTPLYEYPLSKYKSKKNIVGETYTKDGINKLMHFTYSFNKPIMHKEGKGFLGFNYITKTNNTAGTSTITEFNIFDDGVRKYFQIYPKTTTTTNLTTGSILKTTENEFDIKIITTTTNNLAFYPFVHISIDKTWGNDGSFVRKTKKYLEKDEIDEYGNIEEIIQSVDENENAIDYEFKNTITTSYENIDIGTADTRTYIVGRPSIIETKQEKTNYERDLHRIEYTYFSRGEPYWPMIKTKTITPNRLQEDYFKYVSKINYDSYDKYGNLTQQTISAPNDNTIPDRITFFEYDDSKGYDGRFLTSTKKTIDGVDHINHFTYDVIWGNVISETTPAGIQTLYQYDDLGRLEKTIYADNTFTNYYINWSEESGMGELVPENAVFQTMSSSTGNGYSMTFFDKFEREIRTLYAGSNNRGIITDKEYNNNGKLWKVYEPYFWTETKDLFTEFKYDELGRAEEIISPAKTISYTYLGRSIKTKNENTGIEVIENVNAIGKTKSIIDPSGTIQYNYYSSGNIEAINAINSVTSFLYDPAGNRKEISEPNSNISTFEYNAFGELVNQVDSKGNYLLFDYDSFGRLTTQTLFGSKDIPKCTLYNYNNDKLQTGFGQLNNMSLDSYMIYNYTYDGIGRLIEETELVDNINYNSSYEYDEFNGKVSRYEYPSGFAINYEYDYYDGSLKKVKNNENNEIIWESNDINQRGQQTNYTLGNGLITEKGFDDITGLPTTIKTGNIQNLAYKFDKATGNLMARVDIKYKLQESFKYDKMLNSRLTEWNVYNGVNQNNNFAGYSANGNITYKSDVTNISNGEYKYTDNAVTSITSPTPDFLSVSTPQTIHYNGFNKIKHINQEVNEGMEVANYEMRFDYGPGNARKKTLLYRNNIIQKTKVFIGSNYEIEVFPNGIERKLHYIKGGDGLFAIYVQNEDADTMYYIQKDYLGSFYCITGEDGRIILLHDREEQIYSFDPWGRRRKPYNWEYYDYKTTYLFDRGFTGHEHMDKFDLINMNGRVYDPRLGRMLSPDPFVQSPTYSQSYNRYTYAFNNPLKYTDPTGYFAPNINRSTGGWNGLISGVGSFNLGRIRLGSGNHWSDQYRGEYGNFMVSNSSTFNNIYGAGSSELASQLWSNPQKLAKWQQGDLTLSQMRDEGYWVNYSVVEESDWYPENGSENLPLVNIISKWVSGSAGGGVQVQEAAVFALPLLYEVTALAGAYLSYQFYTSRGNPKPVINTYAKDGKPPYWRNPGGLLIQFATSAMVAAVILDRISPQTQNINENPLDFNNKYNPSDMILSISDPAYWNNLTDRQKIGYMNNILYNN